MAFSQQWINWVAIFLASTRIVLNGLPGHRICHARGLGQDDPLLPLLFILTMEVLNALIRTVDGMNLFQTLHDKIGEQTFLYDDDVVIFQLLAAKQQDLVLLHTILNIFGCTSGLKTNGNQCGLEDTATLMCFFPDRLDPFPIKYLGIPLAVTNDENKSLYCWSL